MPDQVSQRAVLVTGSRMWTDTQEVYDALGDQLLQAGMDGNTLVVIHGGCPTGADAIAHDWCKPFFPERVVEMSFNPNWDEFGKAAGPIRNQLMVDLQPDICLAFLSGESRGTRDCVRRARKAGIQVIQYTEGWY